MDTQLEITFIDCLDALARGEPLEQILARHPREAAQLRPLLETAAGLSRLRMEPSEAAKLRSQQKFMAQADLLRRTTPRKTLGFLPRFATGFVAAALIAMVLGTGAVAASGSALPGDPLYGVKRAVENVRLSAALNVAVRDNLQHEFAQRRRDEIGALLTAGRPQAVEFQGPIESLQPDAWIVGGLVVEVAADTAIDGTPEINRMAEVRGVTGPAGLRATAISIGPSGEPAITPTPTIISPAPTSTLIATATPRATQAPASSVAPNVTATPGTTATPQPTRTPAPRTSAPVATATPVATETLEPIEIEFEGAVRSMGPNAWSIDGAMVNILPSTEIRGSITLGQRVKVHALRLATGQLNATHIEPIDSSGPDTRSGNGGDDNQNGGNDNHNENGGNDNHNENGGNDNHNENGGNDNHNENGGNDNHNENGGNDNHNENSANDNGRE